MGDGEQQLPDKQDVARGLLLRGDLFIHLDPRAKGVVVPLHLRQSPQLVLQVGFDMPKPIPDLRVDDAGIFGTLSFGGSPFSVTVPWDAVYALADSHGRAMVWPDSMPAELVEEVEREMGKREPKGLRVVKGGRKSTIPPPPGALVEAIEKTEDAPDPDGDGPTPGRPSHLRVVK